MNYVATCRHCLRIALMCERISLKHPEGSDYHWQWWKTRDFWRIKAINCRRALYS